MKVQKCQNTKLTFLKRLCGKEGMWTFFVILLLRTLILIPKLDNDKLRCITGLLGWIWTFLLCGIYLDHLLNGYLVLGTLCIWSQVNFTTTQLTYIILFASYRYRNWGLVKVSHLPKVKQFSDPAHLKIWSDYKACDHFSMPKSLL